ncbi:hypothetical protein V1525DRAFT_428355 [Lipomyces kononenkoae]|uniref:Uncharacterized protein n=1 Tax=Lipomyces kononenkoae TaxID=34357 RepID=A0ACC3STD5_LIPKO
MQASSASVMCPRSDTNTSSDFKQALYLLKTNPPEQRLDIIMPYSQYVQLENNWSNFKPHSEEKRYPSLSYDSLLQIATIVTTQSALHGHTGAIFREIIASSVNEYISIHKPGAMPCIRDYGSTTVTDPSPSGLSSKEPDQSFGYSRPGFKPRLQVAIECGVSEDYKALCRDKDLWIQHMGAKAVMLICIKEKPHYKSPLTACNIEDKVAEVEKMDQYVAKVIAKNWEEDNYSQIEYRGHIWLGKLDEFFVEVWRAEEQTPVRKWLIRNGRRNPFPRSIGLKISDFFPETEWAACKMPDGNVRFHGGRKLLLVIPDAMRVTAATRFARFLFPEQA